MDAQPCGGTRPHSCGLRTRRTTGLSRGDPSRAASEDEGSPVSCVSGVKSSAAWLTQVRVVDVLLALVDAPQWWYR
jgi:hypothetical protein